jgi:hypothetical protein
LKEAGLGTIRFKEKIKQAGLRYTKIKSFLFVSQSVIENFPLFICLLPFVKNLEIIRIRFKRNDKPVVFDRVSQEVMVLANICTNVQYAVDLIP